MTPRHAVIPAIVAVLAVLLLVPLAEQVATAQGPANEPTKPPYVFPTPIFIPTYAGESPAPTTASSPARTPVPAGGERTYTVVAGDNPWTIAQKVYGNGSRYTIILAANGMTESTRLKVGMVLKIPASDASGNPLPTPPSAAQPTSPPAPTAPTVQPTQAPVSVTATPAPRAQQGSSNIVLDIVMLVVNIATALFLIGAILVGLLALLVYRRSVQWEMMSNMARRLRLRQ